MTKSRSEIEINPICIAMPWVTGSSVHVLGKSTPMFAFNHRFSHEPGDLEPNVMSLPCSFHLAESGS